MKRIISIMLIFLLFCNTALVYGLEPKKPYNVKIPDEAYLAKKELAMSFPKIINGIIIIVIVAFILYKVTNNKHRKNLTDESKKMANIFKMVFLIILVISVIAMVYMEKIYYSIGLSKVW